MTAVTLLVIGVVFSIGAITGIVFLVSLASRKEDHRARLSREAPDRLTNSARFLTGLYVRRPGDDPWHDDDTDDDDYAEYSGPRQDPWA
jgi:hypothetical protein